MASNGDEITPPLKSSGDEITPSVKSSESRTPKSDGFTSNLDDSSSTHDVDDGEFDESGEIDDIEELIGPFCPPSPEPMSPPRSAAYFDCKLCVKMAKEPVVIPCGHLFCGDCLDKWLFFFTSHMACPVSVCRAKVSESSIIQIRPTPIRDRDLLSGLVDPPPKRRRCD